MTGKRWRYSHHQFHYHHTRQYAMSFTTISALFIIVQIGLCLFYLAQVRVCDKNTKEAVNAVPIAFHAKRDVINNVADLLKEDMSDNQENDDENKDGDEYVGNQPADEYVDAINIEDQHLEPNGNQQRLDLFKGVLSDDDDVFQLRKIPVVDFKTHKNRTGKADSYGRLLNNLRDRLKNKLPYLVPKVGEIVHDSHRQFTIVTSTNAAFLDFTENWLQSLDRIGLRYNVSIIAEDAVAYRFLSTAYRNANIQVFATSNNFSSTKALQFLSKEYKALVNRRAEYLLNFLEKGWDVLAADVDAYWFRDPMEIFKSTYDVYDLWVSIGADETRPCPCLMYLKAKPNVIQMVKDWSSRLKRLDGKENDQQALGQVLRQYKIGNQEKGRHVMVAELDKNLFPTGEVFFKPSWWLVHGKRVYVAHANRIGNHDKKVAMFREYKLWLIEPYNVDISESRDSTKLVKGNEEKCC
ncbi:uncharacterized protein [Amphiura filiformis]|uniref:uncharacterized protein isoform X2 n=1 Tax=Amphiura filiformis TaxID=82378 RepID=UPI003B2235DA